jgi:hypothetical protein
MNDLVARNMPLGAATWMHRTGTEGISITTSMARNRWYRASAGFWRTSLRGSPKDRSIRRELDPILRPVVDPVKHGSSGRLDRSESQARGQLDDGVGKAFVRARELAPPGHIVYEAVGVHKALQ